MAIVINGSGTVTGLAVGGLPDGTVDAGTLATDSVTAAKLEVSAITGADLPAGSVLQVVSDTLTSTASTGQRASEGTWADTGLSVAITPSSTSSKIVITGMVNTGSENAGDGVCILRLMRDSTAIAIGDAASNRPRTTTGRGSDSAGAASMLTKTVHWIDSPSSTSAVTYKIEFAARGVGTLTAYINKTSSDTDNTEHQRTASSLTLMEIAG